MPPGLKGPDMDNAKSFEKGRPRLLTKIPPKLKSSYPFAVLEGANRALRAVG